MKKIAVVFIAVIMTLVCGAGCSSGQSPSPTNLRETKKSIVPEASVFGKVKAIIGNEIELEIAKMPVLDDPEESVPNGMVIEARPINPDEAPPEGDRKGGSGARGSAGGGLVPIGTPSSGPSTGLSPGDGGNLELEYTGESATVIVPAGLTIESLRGGEASLSAIKKGSVLIVGAASIEENPITATRITVIE